MNHVTLDSLPFMKRAFVEGYNQAPLGLSIGLSFREHSRAKLCLGRRQSSLIDTGVLARKTTATGNDASGYRRHTDEVSLTNRLRMTPERSQSEWLDVKALQQYACVSERTIREWIHRPLNPLPAMQVGRKILVRRSAFDLWLEGHQLKPVDVGCIVDEIIAGVMH